jgi:hypothetical protein
MAWFWIEPGPIMIGRPIKLSDMTESEKRFGVAPKRGPGIMYRDDTILMEHGDRAIRSFSSNGLTLRMERLPLGSDPIEARRAAR